MRYKVCTILAFLICTGLFIYLYFFFNTNDNYILQYIQYFGCILCTLFDILICRFFIMAFITNYD